MRERGVRVGLGTDSLASNDDLDLFAEMRAALKVSTSLIKADDVLRMATLDGAAALGWGDLVGSLEKGKQADVVVVALPSTASAEATVVEQLVQHASAADVRLTMVAGKVIFRSESSLELSESFQELQAKLVQARAKLGRPH